MQAAAARSTASASPQEHCRHLCRPVSHANLRIWHGHRTEQQPPDSGTRRAPERRQRHRLAAAAASSAAASGPIGTGSQGPAKRVVITGGSRGFGFALAQEFLRAGDSVVLCGRDAARLEAAVAALRREAGGAAAARVHGLPCDCSSPDDVERLGQFVKERLGGVDLWLNNQGEVTAKRLLADVDPHEIARVVGTNVVGSLLGCRQAIRLMREQPVPAGAQGGPAFHIFNYGFSGWGAKFTKSAVTHKATKRALAQLNESLQQELKEAGITSIGVHNLSPGMLLTDLLLRDSTPAARRFFNALAEEPEVVAAALAPRVRSVQGSGTNVGFLTPADALRRVLAGLPQVVNGGRFFDREGRRVARPGEAYQDNGVRVQVPEAAAPAAGRETATAAAAREGGGGRA